MTRIHALTVCGLALLTCVASATTGAPPMSETKGRLYVLTGISYELPSASDVSYEVGLSWYGFGGGINKYLTPEKKGPLVEGRVGLWGGAFAVNASYAYTQDFNENLSWRVGAGLQYVTEKGIYKGADSGLFPIFELSLGLKL